MSESRVVCGRLARRNRGRLHGRERRQDPLQCGHHRTQRGAEHRVSLKAMLEQQLHQVEISRHHRRRFRMHGRYDTDH